MKKNGVLNRELSAEIADMGHTNKMLISDAGFPIPKHINKIDLAITKDFPGLIQVLKAILAEMVIEEVIICEDVKKDSPDFLNKLRELLPNQKFSFVNWKEFKNNAEQSKCAVRTAEFTAFANIIIVAASGIEKYKKGLNVEV